MTDRTRSLLEQIAERQAAIKREMQRLIGEYDALADRARQLRDDAAVRRFRELKP